MQWCQLPACKSPRLGCYNHHGAGVRDWRGMRCCVNETFCSYSKQQRFYGILCQTDFSGNSFENFICTPCQKSNQFCLDWLGQLTVVWTSQGVRNRCLPQKSHDKYLLTALLEHFEVPLPPWAIFSKILESYLSRKNVCVIDHLYFRQHFISESPQAPPVCDTEGLICACEISELHVMSEIPSLSDKENRKGLLHR